MKDRQTIKKEFQQDGFVLIPGFLSEDEVNQINQNFSRAIRDVVPKMATNHVFYEGDASPETLKQLIDIHAYDPFFNEILSTSKFSEIAEFLLEDEVIGKTLEYFNKPAKIGKPTPPHQDGYYFMLNPSVAVTMWMALEPADEENGCVKYIKGSHLNGMRPHGKTQTLGFSQGITDYGTEQDQANLIPMPAKPGDLLIHHSLTVHLAGGNTSENRSRKALGLIYFGRSAKEDLVAKAAYQKKLEEERMANVKKAMIVGHNTYRYEVTSDWGSADVSKYPVADCHEMVLDKQGRLFLLTTETKNNILIYNQAGEITGSWGHDYPGGHGLTIGEESNGEEFLLITDLERHQVIKTSLTGEELMVIDFPSVIDAYKSNEQFSPTETAIGPNGDIYVTDGYGLQYVIQYDRFGKYIRHWGGFGHADSQFDCVHGIAIDNRKHGYPTLIITSRNQNLFKRFTLDGQYLNSIQLPGSFVCRPVIKDMLLYAAVFRSEANTKYGSGYITILDENDQVISSPGGSKPTYLNGILQPQHQETNIFIHPHDVCVWPNGDITVCQWKANGSYPVKLRKLDSN